MSDVGLEKARQNNKTLLGQEKNCQKINNSSQNSSKTQKTSGGEALIFLPLYSVRMDGSKMQLDFTTVDTKRLIQQNGLDTSKINQSKTSNLNLLKHHVTQVTANNSSQAALTPNNQSSCLNNAPACSTSDLYSNLNTNLNMNTNSGPSLTPLGGTVSKRTKLALRKIVTVANNRPQSQSSSGQVTSANQNSSFLTSTNQNLSFLTPTNQNLTHFSSTFETYSAPNTPKNDESFDSFVAGGDFDLLNSTNQANLSNPSTSTSLVRVKNARTLLAEKLKKQKQQTLNPQNLHIVQINGQTLPQQTQILTIGTNLANQSCQNSTILPQNSTNFQQNSTNFHQNSTNLHSNFTNHNLDTEFLESKSKKLKQFHTNSTPNSPIDIQIQQQNQSIKSQNLRKFSLNNAISSGNNVISIGNNVIPTTNGLNRSIYDHTCQISNFHSNFDNKLDTIEPGSTPLERTVINNNSNIMNMNNNLNDYDFYLNFNKPPDSDPVLDGDLLFRPSSPDSSNPMASATFSGNSVLNENELDDPFIGGQNSAPIQKQPHNQLGNFGVFCPPSSSNNNNTTMATNEIDRNSIQTVQNDQNFGDFLDLTGENNVKNDNKKGTIDIFNNEKLFGSEKKTFDNEKISQEKNGGQNFGNSLIETGDSVENVCNAVLASCLGPRSHVLVESANQAGARKAASELSNKNPPSNKTPLNSSTPSSGSHQHPKKPHSVSAFCGFLGPDEKTCRQRCINSYKFCIRHILNDREAPYKACAHIRKAGSKSIGCNNAVLQQKDSDPKYCGTHLIMMGMREPKTKKKKKAPITSTGDQTVGGVSASTSSVTTSLPLTPSTQSNKTYKAASNRKNTIAGNGRGGQNFAFNSQNTIKNDHFNTQIDTQDPFHNHFTIVNNSNNASTPFLQSPSNLSVENDNGKSTISYNNTNNNANNGLNMANSNGITVLPCPGQDPNENSMLFDDPGQYFLLEPAQIQQNSMNDGLLDQGQASFSANTPLNQYNHVPHQTMGLQPLVQQHHVTSSFMAQTQRSNSTASSATPNYNQPNSNNPNNNADFASRPESQLSGASSTYHPNGYCSLNSPQSPWKMPSTPNNTVYLPSQQPNLGSMGSISTNQVQAQGQGQSGQSSGQSQSLSSSDIVRNHPELMSKLLLTGPTTPNFQNFVANQQNQIQNNNNQQQHQIYRITFSAPSNNVISFEEGGNNAFVMTSSRNQTHNSAAILPTTPQSQRYSTFCTTPNQNQATNHVMLGSDDPFLGSTAIFSVPNESAGTPLGSGSGNLSSGGGILLSPVPSELSVESAGSHSSLLLQQQQHHHVTQGYPQQQHQQPPPYNVAQQHHHPALRPSPPTSGYQTPSPFNAAGPGSAPNVGGVAIQHATLLQTPNNSNNTSGPSACFVGNSPNIGQQQFAQGPPPTPTPTPRSHFFVAAAQPQPQSFAHQPQAPTSAGFRQQPQQLQVTVNSGSNVNESLSSNKSNNGAGPAPTPAPSGAGASTGTGSSQAPGSTPAPGSSSGSGAPNAKSTFQLPPNQKPKKVIRLKPKKRRQKMIGRYRQIPVVAQMCRIVEDLEFDNTDLFPLGLEPSSSDSDSEEETSSFLPHIENLNFVNSNPSLNDIETKSSEFDNPNSLPLNILSTARRQLYLLKRTLSLSQKELRKRNLEAKMIGAAGRSYPNSAGTAFQDLRRKKSREISKKSQQYVDLGMLPRRCNHRSPDGSDSQAIRCPEKCVPYGLTCPMHVLSIPDQHLFRYCSAEGAPGQGCPQPAFDVGLEPFPKCNLHRDRLPYKDYGKIKVEPEDGGLTQKKKYKSRYIKKNHRRRRKKLNALTSYDGVEIVNTPGSYPAPDDDDESSKEDSNQDAQAALASVVRDFGFGNYDLTDILVNKLPDATLIDNILGQDLVRPNESTSAPGGGVSVREEMDSIDRALTATVGDHNWADVEQFLLEENYKSASSVMTSSLMTSSLPFPASSSSNPSSTLDYRFFAPQQQQFHIFHNTGGAPVGGGVATVTANQQSTSLQPPAPRPASSSMTSSASNPGASSTLHYWPAQASTNHQSPPSDQSGIGIMTSSSSSSDHPPNRISLLSLDNCNNNNNSKSNNVILLPLHQQPMMTSSTLLLDNGLRVPTNQKLPSSIVASSSTISYITKR